jgi:hypothetical protein
MSREELYSHQPTNTNAAGFGDDSFSEMSQISLKGSLGFPTKSYRHEIRGLFSTLLCSHSLTFAGLELGFIFFDL